MDRIDNKEYQHYLCGQRRLDMHMRQDSTYSQYKVRFSGLLRVSVFLNLEALLIGAIVVSRVPVFLLLDDAGGIGVGLERDRTHSGPTGYP